MKPKSEVELCNVIKAANLFPGFTLHEEVGTDMNGNSVDIVYEHGSAVYCIEAKLNFNFEVVAQALRWKDKATASFVAVPRSTYKSVWDSPKIKVATALGLGVIAVEESRAYFAHPYLDPFEETLPEWEWTLQAGVADMDFWGKIFARIGENKAAAGSAAWRAVDAIHALYRGVESRSESAPRALAERTRAEGRAPLV